MTSPDLVTAGDVIKITATVTGGAIESGQGTATIKVDTSGAVSGFITATVDVGGYDRECPTSSSSTTSVDPKKDEKPQKPPR